MTSPPNQVARRLFAPIASTYERWANVLSLGQDARWRRAMVTGLTAPKGSDVLDVAAGTGSISRLLRDRGYEVTALDLSREMLSRHPEHRRVIARGEQLPFPDHSFDGLTFGYLLRYVVDPIECLTELARVVRPGGQLGMVEFGLPRGMWNPLWRLYSGALLPLAGRLVGEGWLEVGTFLRGSIEDFHKTFPDPGAPWAQAGLADIKVRRLSLGGGLVVWGRKP